MKKAMMRLLVALFALSLASGAFAFGCPNAMKKIDEALAAYPQLTEEQLAEVKALRAEGEKLHDEGKHQEASDTLAKAKEILGIDKAM
jgi:hypothetical protein